MAATDVLVELRRNSIAFVSTVNRRKRVAAAFSAATDGTHTQQLSQGRRMKRLFVCSVPAFSKLDLNPDVFCVLDR